MPTPPSLNESAPVVEPITHKEFPTPWRDVPNEDILSVIHGTYLGALTEKFACVTEPPLPLETSMLKALVIIGCALSEPVTGWNGCSPMKISGDGNIAMP